MPGLAMYPLLAFIGGIGTTELIVVAVLSLLVFGKRLPEVGRSVGRSIVEFKRGLAGIEEDLDQATRQPPQIERLEPPTASAGAEASDRSAALPNAI